MKGLKPGDPFLAVCPSAVTHCPPFCPSTTSVWLSRLQFCSFPHNLSLMDLLLAIPLLPPVKVSLVPCATLHLSGNTF